MNILKCFCLVLKEENCRMKWFSIQPTKPPTPLIISTSLVSDYFNLACTCLFHARCFPSFIFLCLGAELRGWSFLPQNQSSEELGSCRFSKPSWVLLRHLLESEKGRLQTSSSCEPSRREREATSWEKRVVATLHREPHFSPNILIFLLAPWEVSSTLNSTTVCREADVPLLMIPSDPVPEMDKLKISLTSNLRSTFPLIIREAWEWLQGCKQLNLEARGRGVGSGSNQGRLHTTFPFHTEDGHTHFRLFPASFSLSFHPILISSIFALGQQLTGCKHLHYLSKRLVFEKLQSFLKILNFLPSHLLTSFLKIIYLRERARAWTWVGKSKGGGRKNLKQTPCWARRLGLDPTTVGSWLEMKPRVRCLVDWVTQGPHISSLHKEPRVRDLLLPAYSGILLLPLSRSFSHLNCYSFWVN